MNEAYLAETETIDYRTPIIRKKVLELRDGAKSTMDYIAKAYEFVRDEIPHSWDIQSTVVSRKASEVLVNKADIC
ncbi:MAG: hypothetical protein IJ088_07680 [Clostridia bacterium]|nr:hypothetical protein [Clostridia bacterium]